MKNDTPFHWFAYTTLVEGVEDIEHWEEEVSCGWKNKLLNITTQFQNRGLTALLKATVVESELNNPHPKLKYYYEKDMAGMGEAFYLKVHDLMKFKQTELEMFAKGEI
jgi:hypothetical protein